MSNARAKSCMSFSSAETISNNIDILSEILVRVPAKSLLKFKCVSKLWLSLISDPKFCFRHARLKKIRDPMPSALLLNRFCPTTRSIRKFHRVPLKNDRDAVLTKIPNLDYLNVRVFKIMQSCNGLLLCSSYYEKKDDCKKKFFVCNPTTKQFKALSFPFDGNAKDLFLSLAFDPVRSPHYKVLSVRVQDFKVDRYLIDLYSSETDSWNSLETPFFKIPFGIELDAGVFCNGSIHWYSCEKNSLYFDLDCESLKILPMPSMVLRDQISIYDVLYFGESREHLHMVVAQKGSVLEFDVLQLTPDYSGWFLRYQVDLHAMRAASPHLTWRLHCRQFSVLSFVDAGKEEESLFVIFVYGKAMSYNFVDGTIIEICDLWQIPKIITDARVYKTWLGRKYYEGRDAYDYFESLICL